MIFKNMKKIHKKASTMIYVLFLLTISLTLATLFLNNTSIFKNTFNFNNYETKLYENMQKDADLLVKLDKKLNSNGSGFVDNLSCPEVYMSWTTNSWSFDTELKIENEIPFCSWNFNWENIKVFFNSAYTGFLAIDYKQLEIVDFTSKYWYDVTSNVVDWKPDWERIQNEYSWEISWSIESQNKHKDFFDSYNNTESTFELTRNFSKDWSIFFQYKIKSYNVFCIDTDYLVFKINWEEKWKECWDKIWTMLIPVEEWTNKFTWSFVKDGIVDPYLLWSHYAVIFKIKFQNSDPIKADISDWEWVFDDGTIIKLLNYKQADWFDDNINSDNYIWNSTWTTDYPDNYEDDDADARKEINWYVREENIYKKILWTNSWFLDMINKNKNNVWISVKLWEVSDWVISLKTDKNTEIKVVEFDRDRFKNNWELIVLDSQTWSISFGTWYIQSNLSLWSDKNTAKKFNFQNKDYAIFLKSNSWAVLYNLRVETSAGSGTYIVPIDDSLENKIEFLANEIIIDKKNNYIYKEKKFIYEKNKFNNQSFIWLIWDDTSWRTWADWSLAKSCNKYKNPNFWYKYAWNTWDGIYKIFIDWNELLVYCDMTTDWGGWTRVIRTNSDNHDWGQKNHNYTYSHIWDNIWIYETYKYVKSFWQIMLKHIESKTFAAYNLVETSNESIYDLMTYCKNQPNKPKDDNIWDWPRIKWMTSDYSWKKYRWNMENVDYFFVCWVNEESDNDQSYLTFARSTWQQWNWYSDSWRNCSQKYTTWSLLNWDYYNINNKHIWNGYSQCWAWKKGDWKDWYYEIYIK